MNRYTRRAYRDEPTIMAWELANEPEGAKSTGAMNRWFDDTARLLKGLAPRHLVTTGSEGMTADGPAKGNDVVYDHRSAAVDFVSFHLWVENWGIYDPERHVDTFPRALEFAAEYIERHIRYAEELGKPIVLEEFGLARDRGSREPTDAARSRARYFREIFQVAERAMMDGRPFAGTHFWAWSGEGRPRLAGGEFQAGDAWLGDPPHEPQGWYGVYDDERETLDTIRKHVRRVNALSR